MLETLGIHFPTLLIYLVNFLLVLGLLFLFAYKPILRLMDQRSDRIRESLEASERAREEAASSQEAVEAQLVEARRESQRILEQARESAERFRAEEMERARNEAENFVERARADIQRERDVVIEEVRASFGDLAMTAAERVSSSSPEGRVFEITTAQGDDQLWRVDVIATFVDVLAFRLSETAEITRATRTEDAAVVSAELMRHVPSLEAVLIDPDLTPELRQGVDSALAAIQ